MITINRIGNWFTIAFERWHLNMCVITILSLIAFAFFYANDLSQKCFLCAEWLKIKLRWMCSKRKRDVVQLGKKKLIGLRWCNNKERGDSKRVSRFNKDRRSKMLSATGKKKSSDLSHKVSQTKSLPNSNLRFWLSASHSSRLSADRRRWAVHWYRN